MAQFPPDARVAVRPIAKRLDGESVTIGDLARQVFLTIPAECLEILDALATGKTVGETATLYEQAHGETPDLEDFLALLADEGFVARWQEGADDPLASATEAPSLGWISPALARHLIGGPLVALCGLMTAIAVALVASDPAVIPGPSALVFHHHLAVLFGGLTVVTTVGVIVHELGHLLAARGSDVPARIGVGHRLWVLVFETDMTGIWMTSKRRRYLAFLAGPMIDAVSAAILIGVLWADRRGWVGLPPAATRFTSAVLFTYLMRLGWECFVFVRTDVYYVIATALDCKSLLADTEDLLRNRLALLRRRPPVVDQSAIPPAEMRAVRGYAPVWLAGRALAFASLFLITLPVVWDYLAPLARASTGGHTSYSTADLLTLAVVVLGTTAAGIYMWIRSLLEGQMQRRTDAVV